MASPKRQSRSVPVSTISSASPIVFSISLLLDLAGHQATCQCAVNTHGANHPDRRSSVLAVFLAAFLFWAVAHLRWEERTLARAFEPVRQGGVIRCHRCVMCRFPRHERTPRGRTPLGSGLPPREKKHRSGRYASRTSRLRLAWFGIETRCFFVSRALERDQRAGFIRRDYTKPNIPAYSGR